jgi:hypothetical protein
VSCVRTSAARGASRESRTIVFAARAMSHCRTLCA